MLLEYWKSTFFKWACHLRDISVNDIIFPTVYIIIIILECFIYYIFFPLYKYLTLLAQGTIIEIVGPNTENIEWSINGVGDDEHAYWFYTAN